MNHVLRAGRHLVRLLTIAAILARYDAVFPLERVNGTRWLVWIFRVFARRDQGLRSLRPGQRLALGAAGDGAELHQARPSAVDPRRS